MVDAQSIIEFLLIIFLPPLAVFLHANDCNAHVLLNIVLTILGKSTAFAVSAFSTHNCNSQSRIPWVCVHDSNELKRKSRLWLNCLTLRGDVNRKCGTAIDHIELKVGFRELSTPLGIVVAVLDRLLVSYETNSNCNYPYFPLTIVVLGINQSIL
ncbi:hypothetical protein M3Y98_01158700 [Aphelenchoides besseyi]|nr:hypothetical protein M3Y98_01158700 [Aphelenchoides besseyi]KAI6210853.1 hypothetical protein M3Y96_00371900 [Aphelenchoides besseyi]